MKRSAILSMLFVVGLFVQPVSSEIYKYRDNDGFVRYTYDLGEVPEDQRPGIQTYEESASAVEAPAAEQKVVESSANKDEENEPADDALPVVDEQKIEELNQKDRKSVV